jgi:hypothetical protein
MQNSQIDVSIIKKMEKDTCGEKIQEESKKILETINEMVIQLNETTATAIGNA